MSDFSLRSFTPYSPSDQLPDSPWDVPSPSGSGYDSLTLPPINPDNNYENIQLPSFDNSHYFDALPHISSPFHQDPFQELSQRPNEREPPPSNQQQVRRHLPPISQYHLGGSESPDPFEDFVDLTPPPRSPGQMPARSHSTTRTSSVVDLTESSPPKMAPRKRKAETPGVGRAGKAARAGSSNSMPSKRNSGDIPIVDLSCVDDAAQYEALKKRQQDEAIRAQNEADAKRPAKLAEFQCIICMDNPTDLTVTHCGHLFCSECLYQALYAGDKKCCPVCRAAISMPRPGAKQGKNGLFSLEMKLMTANKKGKQPVRVL